MPPEGNAEQSCCEGSSRDILLVAAYMINLPRRPSRTLATQNCQRCDRDKWDMNGRPLWEWMEDHGQLLNIFSLQFRRLHPCRHSLNCSLQPGTTCENSLYYLECVRIKRRNESPDKGEADIPRSAPLICVVSTLQHLGLRVFTRDFTMRKKIPPLFIRDTVFNIEQESPHSRSIYRIQTHLCTIHR